MYVCMYMKNAPSWVIVYLDMPSVHLPVDEAIFSVKASLGASLSLSPSLSLSLSYHLHPTLPLFLSLAFALFLCSPSLAVLLVTLVALLVTLVSLEAALAPLSMRE
jgi:hypothetical protein